MKVLIDDGPMAGETFDVRMVNGVPPSRIHVAVPGEFSADMLSVDPIGVVGDGIDMYEAARWANRNHPPGHVEWRYRYVGRQTP